jgi:hypothetical protein
MGGLTTAGSATASPIGSVAGSVETASILASSCMGISPVQHSQQHRSIIRAYFFENKGRALLMFQAECFIL